MARKESSKVAGTLGREGESLRTHFAGVIDAIGRVAQSWDLDTALQEVAHGACSLTGARYAAVCVFDHLGQVKQFVTSGFAPEQDELLESLRTRLDLFGYPNETQEPLRLADFPNHSPSIGFPENHSPVKTLLGVPLRHLDKSIGNIYVMEKEEDHEFTGEDEETLMIFASQAAIAIHNALRHGDEEHAKDQVETERRHWWGLHR